MTILHTFALVGPWVLIVAWAASPAAGQGIATLQDPPPRNPGTPPVMCKLAGPLVRIPSKTAPDGVRVRISPPAKGRYSAGAPVAVQVNAGAVPTVDQARLCLRDEGFIDVGWDCAGSENQMPDGARLEQQQRCMDPLADVLAFATGRIRSLENKSIQDYAGALKVLTSNVGIVAWSAGGNLATLTMARHGDRFSDLAWYASWESPVLSSVDGGWGSVFQPNPFYDPRTGQVDFSRLRYSPEMPVWTWPLQGLRPDAARPRGGLYLDGDANRVFNRDADYAFWVMYTALTERESPKSFYTQTVTREARARKVFGPSWPSHIATVEEVERRADAEDVIRHIPAAAKRLTRLAVTVFESERGHVTNSADHPHAIAQVNAWLDTGVRWVRLNPDVHYVQRDMGTPPLRAVQNPAGRRLDRTSIAGLVEAEADEGGPTDAQGMAAAACELADRTSVGAWTPVLTKPIQ